MPVEDVTTAISDHKARIDNYALFRDYDEGRHQYPFATQAFRKRYEWLIKRSRANLMPAVVEGFSNLVRVKSWVGAGAERAAELAETTDLTGALSMAVRESWLTGDGYVLAWPGLDGRVRPWFHRASQVAYKADPEDPARFAWVAKIWTDAKYGRVNVYYPDRVERWVTVSRVHEKDTSPVTWPDAARAWVPFDRDGQADTIRHPYGRVPWVHLPRDPREQGGHGHSILQDAIPVQDALNHAMAALVTNTEKFAAPTRALLNYVSEAKLDPVTGQFTMPKLDVDDTKNTILGVEGPGPLTQLDPPDSENLTRVLEHWGSWIARVVGMPASDIVPDLGNIPSGASLRVLAARRTAKVRDYTDLATARVADLMGLLGVEDARPVWHDPAPRDETEELAAAQARQDLGFALDDNLMEMGYSESDRARITGGAAREQALIGRVAREAFMAGEDTVL